MEVTKHYNRPTKYDIAPFGQIWLAELEDGSERWIQLSMEENGALWSKLGDFLEDNIFEEEISQILKRYM